MTDSSPPDSTAVPDQAVGVDPAVVNGQCEQADSQQQEPHAESHGGGFKMDQEMKISESIDDRGRWHQTCEVGFMCQQAGCTGSRIMSVYNEGNRSSSVFMLP